MQVTLKLLLELIPLQGHVHRGLEEAQLISAVVAQPLEEAAENRFFL